jgi:hypothetical protein
MAVRAGQYHDGQPGPKGRGVAFVGLVLMMAPTLIAYIFLQKHLTKGMTAGTMMGDTDSRHLRDFTEFDIQTAISSAGSLCQGVCSFRWSELREGAIALQGA